MSLEHVDRAWSDVREIWECGFSIVATALNELLALHSTGLAIRAAPPAIARRLQDCRHDLLDALRRTLVPLPPENEIVPWSVGFVNGPENKEVRIGDGYLDPDERLKSIVDFLHRQRWTIGQWENQIVLPVERSAKEWRNWIENHGSQPSKSSRSRKRKRQGSQSQTPSKQRRRQPTITQGTIHHPEQPEADSGFVCADDTDRQHPIAATESEITAGADAQPPALRPFSGGPLVYLSDRVELCGVDICSGSRPRVARRVLDILRQRDDQGRLMAFGSDNLAEKAQVNGGQNRVPGLIRDLRRRISQALRHGANIQCGPNDVILSGGPGYRFADHITVQDGNTLIRDSKQVQGGNSGSRDDPVNDPVTVPESDPVSDPVNDPVSDTATGSLSPEADDRVAVRQARLIAELGKGVTARAPGLATALGCSTPTVKRDIRALGDLIEFVGHPRNGYYRLREVNKPR
jgi:hypothetical protein